MNLEEIPTYSAGELERIADRLLRERWQPEVVMPVDIDLLVEQEPGVVLDYRPGLEQAFGVVGAVVHYPEGETFTIYIDQDVADHRPNFYRFTLAEEFAHLVLHRSVIQQAKTLEDAAWLHEWLRYKEIDRNAKRLAAALLMPPRHVLEDAAELYQGMVRHIGFENPAAVKKYLVDQLSRRYRVSREAMGHRLEEWPIRVVEKVDAAMREGLDFLD
ncbi:MAG: ImmA/IrrE family metallo-endopeptidase [Candidatus Methylomirabilales bacterium]